MSLIIPTTQSHSLHLCVSHTILLNLFVTHGAFPHSPAWWRRALFCLSPLPQRFLIKNPSDAQHRFTPAAASTPAMALWLRVSFSSPLCLSLRTPLKRKFSMVWTVKTESPTLTARCREQLYAERVVSYARCMVLFREQTEEAAFWESASKGSFHNQKQEWKVLFCAGMDYVWIRLTLLELYWGTKGNCSGSNFHLTKNSDSNGAHIRIWTVSLVRRAPGTCVLSCPLVPTFEDHVRRIRGQINVARHMDFIFHVTHPLHASSR